MKIGSDTYEAYLQRVRDFHGSLAPGLIIGGFIVDLALRNRPPGELFDALCETPVCLPDAVQLLTPCTIGNGWLTVLDIGRFAVTLYEKQEGEGVRVYLDTRKLERWPEIRDWYLKRKTKAEQDFPRLLAEIREAGHDLLGMQRVRVIPERVRRKRLGPVGPCPGCGEAYPLRDGDRCRCCAGETPYAAVAAPETST